MIDSTWNQIFDSLWNHYKNQENTLIKLLELDDNSNNFFLFKIEEEKLSYSIQKKLWKQSNEIYKETGQSLLYLSSPYYENEEDVKSPILLCPIELIYSKKENSINWKINQDEFFLNSTKYLENYSCTLDEMPSQLEILSDLLETKHLVKETFAIYYSKDLNDSVKRDLIKLNQSKSISSAMKKIVSFETYTDSNELPKASYSDLIHVLNMDRSQYEVIASARHKDMILSGPPGTGKSQTIINLALNEVYDNKKVLIVSEKKAALDVIHSRINELKLDNLVLRFDIPTVDIYKKIEDKVELVFNYKKKDDFFNHNYYSYCHKTIEQYFDAFYIYKNKKNETYRDIILNKNEPVDFLKIIDVLKSKNSLTLLSLIYPNKEFLGMKFSEIQDTIIHFIENLAKIDFDSLELRGADLLDLKQITELFNSVDSTILQRWFKRTEALETVYFQKVKSIEILEKKIIKVSLPYNLQILDSEIQKLIDFYKNYSFLKKLFSKDISILDNKCSHSISGWLQKSSIEKIEILNTLKNSISIKKECSVQKEQLEEWIEQMDLKPHIATLKYISNKKKDKNHLWKFVLKMYRKNEPKQLKHWKELMYLVQEVKSLILDFNSLEINSLVNNWKSYSRIEMRQMDWDYLCSYNPISRSNWREFITLNHENTTDSNNIITRSDTEEFVKQHPILKNYTYREIIQLKNQVNSLEPHFQQYSIQKVLNKNLESLMEACKVLEKKYLKKTSEEYEKKLKLLEQIKFIHKKWSQKKQKISFSQYFSKIDSQFLLELFPIVIATPHEASKFLELKSEMFDTVIYDESSQIPFKNAIPTLFRAKKSIIVGDRMQLTPTIFFKSDASFVLNNSLLNLASENLPTTRLNYHYRSKYKELIQFSNQNFYESGLIATLKSDKKAILLDYLPDAIYQDRKNIMEAKAVVKHLKVLATKNDSKSIGIACFSLQQKLEIEHQIDLEGTKDVEFYNFIEKKRNESEYLFVKNIESLQGDERDIIIISVGYGKNKDGELHYYFGPILGFQGENRLNVLASRAKEHIIAITSMRSQEIHTKETSKNGLVMFKQFLAWLEKPDTMHNGLKPVITHYLDFYFNPFKIKR